MTDYIPKVNTEKQMSISYRTKMNNGECTVGQKLKNSATNDKCNVWTNGWSISSKAKINGFLRFLIQAE